MLLNIARKIVRTCLRVKRGEMVSINTWSHMLRLAEEIAFECYMVGAVPFITIMSDRLWYRLMSEVPVENLSRTPTHLLKSVEAEDVCINIHGPEVPNLSRLRPENLEAYRVALRPIFERERARGVRVLDIFLGKVTPERAKLYGLEYERWYKTILESLDVDYTRMKAIGVEMGRTLSRACEARIVNELGTDLRLRLNGRTPFINDGIIDEQDLKAGRNSSMLPAGAVEIAPLEFYAEGRVVFDAPHYAFGMKIKGMEWMFKDGRLVEIRAEGGEDVLRRYLDRISGEWSRVGRLVIGLNPAIRPPCIFDQLAEGAVSIGIGYNMDIGGRNNASAQYSATLLRATLEVDGKIIVENGKLVLESGGSE